MARTLRVFDLNTGYSLEADLVSADTDELVETIELSELANAKTVYEGPVVTAAAGDYVVLVRQGDDIIATSRLLLASGDGVYEALAKVRGVAELGVSVAALADDLTAVGTAVNSIGEDLTSLTATVEGFVAEWAEDGPLYTELHFMYENISLVLLSLPAAEAPEIELQIRTAANLPLPDCHVWISSDSAGQVVVQGTFRTDYAGKFKVKLTPGIYYVWRRHPDYEFDDPETLEIT